MKSPSSANFSRLGASERRALQSEAMGLGLVAARRIGYWCERLRKKASIQPSTKDALKLFAPVPRSSELPSRLTQCHQVSSDCEKTELVAF